MNAYADEYETVSFKCCYKTDGSYFCYYVVDGKKGGMQAYEVVQGVYGLVDQLCLGALALPLGLLGLAGLVGAFDRIHERKHKK